MSGRKTLLWDARLLLEKPTGIGRYIASLVPELLAIAPDWTFHLLRRAEPWPGYGVADWRARNLVHHVTAARHMSLAQHVAIPRRARALGADLVHYPHFDAPVLFGSVPVVATVHGVLPLVHPEAFRRFSLPKRVYMRACHHATFRRAAAVLAVSDSTAKEIVRFFPAAAPRVTAIPLAADVRFRRASDETIREFRDRHRLARPFVLALGEFRRHKNTTGLLAAWAKASARRSHDLLLVGVRHPDGDVPEDEIAKLGLGDSVRVLTGLSADDVVAAYSAAAVFAIVSIYEGFGLPVLEAMACDVPVIASGTTATAEVAGDAAVLVDPAEPAQIAAALDRLVASPDERTRLVQAGRLQRDRFSWRRTAERTLEVYERVVRART